MPMKAPPRRRDLLAREARGRLVGLVDGRADAAAGGRLELFEGEAGEEVELVLRDLARVQLERPRELRQDLALGEACVPLHVARGEVVLALARGQEWRSPLGGRRRGGGDGATTAEAVAVRVVVAVAVVAPLLDRATTAGAAAAAAGRAVAAAPSSPMSVGPAERRGCRRRQGCDNASDAGGALRWRYGQEVRWPSSSSSNPTAP